MGGLYDSEYHYNEALKLESHDVTVYLGLANVERHKGEYQKALNVLNKAELNIGNDDPQLLASRADILERKGDKDAAHDILNKLASEDNMTVLAVATFSRLCLHFDRCDEALELIVASSSLPSTTLTEQQSLMYAAGDLLDKLKRYDEAMEYYVKANSLLGIKCDRESYIKEVDEIIQCFNKDATLSFPRATTNSTRPVFVLGMPRSGTTLVEQILASHPDVYGAGELPYMKQAAISITGNTLVRDGDYARFMTNVDQDTMTRVADKYLQSLTNLNRDAKYVVDKMPHNFFNVGLIATLFPDARIIHCRRNPLDNALSIYFQSFLWAHDYAFDLSDIGFFYNQYDRLMQHWEDVLEIPIITVQYENLVNDQEKTSRMLLDFCGLEWDDAVLNFHNVSRDIATASYDQVRQPIYHSSKERWKNYKVHLEPLLTELNINISMTD
jgi:tetratricopeptide (TPR) repeat protein